MEAGLLLAIAAPFAAASAVWVRDRLTGEDLLRDLRDGQRIRNLDIEGLDGAWRASPARSRVLVSLTTIPSRLGYIGDTLKSLLTQTRLPARIRLNLPHFSKRENAPYVMPAWLRRLQAVHVVRCEDHGPATKFIPTLLDEPSDRLVVVVDDDRIYPPRLIEDLEAAAAAAPHAALGAGGWIVPPDMIDRSVPFASLFPRPPARIISTKVKAPCPVDILRGVCGYAVRPRFFDLAKLADYADAPAEAFFVDDIWLSGHCRVPKLVIPMTRTNFYPRRRTRFYRSNGLARLDGDRRRNSVMLRHFGAECWHVGKPFADAQPAADA